MAKKRETKEERKLREWNQLANRISDICSGAAGMDLHASSESQDGESPLCPEVLSRAIPALEAIFGGDNEQEVAERKHLWRPHNLNRYLTVWGITTFLHQNGVRA